MMVQENLKSRRANPGARLTAFEAFPERMGRFLFGDDIFISYSRRDGMAYAQALATNLAEYSCYLDLLGTIPGKTLPLLLRRRINRCTIFVLVGTYSAVRSPSVKEEIQEFAKTGRPIIPISFEEAIENSELQALLSGLPLATEELMAATSGTPSAPICDRIRKSFTYTRRSVRLRKLVLWIAALIVAILGGGAIYRSNLVTNTARQVETANREAQCVQARQALDEHERDKLSYHEYPEGWIEQHNALEAVVNIYCGE